MAGQGLFRPNEERRRKISTRKRFHFNIISWLCAQLFHAVGLAAFLAPATCSAAARVQQLDTQDNDAQGSAVKIAPPVLNDPELASGFQLLYQLKFDDARQRFSQGEQERPAEPLGPSLEAASNLFEEFYRKGVLTSEFFLDDNRLLGGIKDRPDAELERQFASAVQGAQKLARARIAKQPKDPHAVFALRLI